MWCLFSLLAVSINCFIYLLKFTLLKFCVDMAKRAGRVGFRSGQSGRGLKRVIFKRVAGCVGLRVRLS